MTNNERQRLCHICGYQKFTWGVLEGRDRHKFRVHSQSVLHSVLGIVKNQYSVEARACQNCGNIQMFIAE